MARKNSTKANGKPERISSVASQSAGLRALAALDELKTERERLYEDSPFPMMDEEIARLDGLIKTFVLDKYAAGDGFEDGTFKVTKVQGHRRWWDGTKLEKILPKGLFLQAVDYIPSPEKIDALVKAGKVERKKIEKAYMQEPNNPYVKVTKKSKSNTSARESEADSLAAKLG